MNALSLKETVNEQARLRALADQLLPLYAKSLIERVHPELNAFLRVQRWDLNPDPTHDWQFPGWLCELIGRSQNNLSLTATVRRHDIQRHGFKSYRALHNALARLAETWNGTIDIHFAYFSSKDRQIADTTFARRTKDISAYMKIYFFAHEFGDPDNRNYF